MIYRFGAFELDPETAELRHEGEPVRLQPKPFELLSLLVRERGRIVTLDELFDALWPDTAVTPSSLTRAVSHARRAIGDTHKGTLIRSYSKRGYRFCGDVVEMGSRDPAGARVERPLATPVDDADRPFVGRDDARRRLLRGFDGALRGETRWSLLTGPPGIGKTRLLEVVRHDVEARGGRVIGGRGRDGEGVPAFWMWVQVLRDLLQDEASHELLARAVAHSPELAGLLPGLGEAKAAPAPADVSADVSAEQGRFLLFEAVAGCLRESAMRRPVWLVLDDVQWAGVSSLRLIEHLLFELRSVPLGVVVAVRDAVRDPTHPVNRLVGQLNAAERCETVALGRFSRAEVGELLQAATGSRPPADLTSELHARTEGVPLFLREAIRLLVERGDLQQPDLLHRTGITLPRESLGLIQRGLGALSVDTARLVGAAAVVGRDFSLPFVAELAEVERSVALDLLDEAARESVIEELPEAPARYRFVHALYQEAAYEALTTGMRARLHRRAAQRLERVHESDLQPVIAELAHHHHQSLAVGDPERAYQCAMAAAERARALLAWSEAARHYEQAAEALDHAETVDPMRRFECWMALVETYAVAGDRARRREVCRKAVAMAREQGRPEDQARAAIGFCDVAGWAVRDDEARDELADALEAIEDGDLCLRARATSRLAFLDSRIAKQAAEERARTALVWARESADRDALIEALYSLHFIIAGPDDLPERRELAAELRTLGAASAHRELALIALIDVACDALERGVPADTARHRAEIAELVGEMPAPGEAWHIQVFETGLALLEGRFDDARERAERALGLGVRIGHPYAQGCHNAHVVELAGWAGDDEALLERFEPIVGLRSGPVDWVKATVARALHRTGDAERACALFEELAADAFRAMPRNIRWTRSIVEVAHLCADLGDADRAEQLVPLLEPVVDRHGVLPVPVCYGGPVAWASARLAQLRGRLDEAGQLYAEALEGARALGARPTEAAILLDQGAMLARRRSLGEARKSLARSAELAAELGLDALRSRARSVLSS